MAACKCQRAGDQCLDARDGDGDEGRVRAKLRESGPEYARVPEGLLVRACAPNFDLWRRGGTLECDENTLVEIDTVNTLRGCPQTGPYTLIECLQPLQTDASVVSLHWRPAENVTV